MNNEQQRIRNLDGASGGQIVSDYQIIDNNGSNLIICFSGLWLSIDRVPIFEFGKSLSSVESKFDILLLRDYSEFWYLHGLKNTCADFDSFLGFLQRKIDKYDKVIAIGASSGGYASILFSSLLNFDGCIAFMPQTDLRIASKHNDWSLNKINPILNTAIGQKYQNLNSFINKQSKYHIYSVNDIDDLLHGPCHFDNVSHHANVFKLSDNANYMIKNQSLFRLIYSF